MLIDYSDLVEQLKQFRLDVAKVMAEQDAEIAALHQAILSSKPIDKERLKQLRLEARKRLLKLEELRGQDLNLLHERR
jgi:hypothetical protein